MLWNRCKVRSTGYVQGKSLSTQRLSSTVAPPLQPCCNMRRRGATLWACKNTLLF